MEIELLLIVWVALVVVVVVLPLVAISQIMTPGKLTDPQDKTPWILVVLFLPIFGSILFFNRMNKLKEAN